MSVKYYIDYGLGNVEVSKDLFYEIVEAGDYPAAKFEVVASIED